MSDQRSLIAYEYWKDSTQRFDYFVTALIGAMVTYIGQSFVPEKLGLTPSTLELVSLLILVASFVCAFKRIEASTEAFRFMSNKLDAAETLEVIHEAQSKSQIFQDLRSGEVFDTEKAEEKKSQAQTKLKLAGEVANKFGNKAAVLYRWRNNLLFAGFLLLLLARLLKAYQIAA